MVDDDELKKILGSLTRTQIDALKNALAETVPESKVLSAEQIREMKGEAAEFRQAQKQISEAVGVLWNARLDMAITSGDMGEIRRVMGRPVEFYDNCDCHHPNGGTACW